MHQTYREGLLNTDCRVLLPESLRWSREGSELLISNKFPRDGDAAGPGRHPEHRCSRLKSLLERRGPKELGDLPQVTQWRQDQGTELAFSSSSLSLSSSWLSLFVESFPCARHIYSLLQLALGPNSTQELNNYSQRGYCYRQNVCVPPSNSSFEAITPSVMVFGGGTYKR